MYVSHRQVSSSLSEDMRTPSTGNEQTAAPATPSTPNAPKTPAPHTGTTASAPQQAPELKRPPVQQRVSALHEVAFLSVALQVPRQSPRGCPSLGHSLLCPRCLTTGHFLPRPSPSCRTPNPLAEDMHIAQAHRLTPQVRGARKAPRSALPYGLAVVASQPRQQARRWRCPRPWQVQRPLPTTSSVPPRSCMSTPEG